MSAEAFAGFLTAFVTAVSAMIIWFQIRTDHERSRRELATNLLREWSLAQKIDTSATIRFVKLLNTEQCKKLAKREPFALEDSLINRAAMQRCLESKFPGFDVLRSVKDGWIQVSGDQSLFIRFNVVFYLNIMESILSSWNSRIASPDILEEQFKHLKFDDNDLLEYRNALKQMYGDTDVFPSITNFMMAIRSSTKPPLKFVDFLRGWT